MASPCHEPHGRSIDRGSQTTFGIQRSRRPGDHYGESKMAVCSSVRQQSSRTNEQANLFTIYCEVLCTAGGPPEGRIQSHFENLCGNVPPWFAESRNRRDVYAVLFDEVRTGHHIANVLGGFVQASHSRGLQTFSDEGVQL